MLLLPESSTSHFLLPRFFPCNLPQKCHYVPVSAPAIRDRLTFYCDLGLFSRHSLLVGCFIVVVNVSVAAQGRRYPCSAAHFCFYYPSFVQTWLFPCCRRHGTAAVNADSEHVEHTRRQRGNVKHSL